jgi:Na+/glutamate symporter
MWPFRRKQKSRVKKSMENLVAGLIIGGAIGSIVGRKLLEKHDDEEGLDEAEEADENELE